MSHPQPNASVASAHNELYFRQLCDTLGVALIATDPDMNISVWNTAATRMFGAAAEQMIGARIGSIIPQDGRELAERFLKRAIDTGQVSQLEFQHRDAQGNRRELAATIAPVVAESGRRVGASACFRDITNRIDLQHELEQTHKMAALGEMAGAVAHHFNNVLGGILTRIDFVRAHDDPQEYERMLEPVSRGLTRAMALVNGLLAFSEGDRRTDDLADLTEIANEIAHETERNIKDRRIEFTLNLARLPVVPLPRVSVLTILRNILQNAIEAVPDGGTIRIEVTLEDNDAVFRVTDTGVGLKPEDQSRIFEPFWSTKGVLSEGAGRATGMGLAIAHGLSHMIGGSISVRSQPLKETCFTVVVPIAESR